jgi:hypothetical protein
MVGRRKALMKELAQIVLATAAALAWMVAPVHAGDPAPASGSIYNGQWSCEFRQATKPGGTLVKTAAYDDIVNYLEVAVKSSFQVDKNGSFSWEERKNGSCRGDRSITYIDGKTTSDSFDMAAVLKVAGQVVDAKTRALKVTVEFWAGTGRFANLGGGTTFVVSADGSTQTYFPNIGPTFTRHNPHPPFVWELKPVSIEQQDLGPDQQREIVTYKGSRGIKPPVAGETVAGGGDYATEHIEIRQVRELKLVPRG